MDRPFFDLNNLVKRIFDEVAEMSADSLGVSRPAFSDTETNVLEYLEKTAKEYGIVVWQDPCKNYVFSLPEHEKAEKYVLVGSHVDSVPKGGNFDGLAGIVAGLICLIKAKQTGQHFTRPVKVIALRGEESHWFGPCYVGSKCLTGQLSQAELLAKHKGDGLSLESHMSSLGIDVDPLRNGSPVLDVGSVLEYVELHIEQGPMLVEKRLPASIVSGIRGNFRHKKITCVGEAGHSGAVPRAYRHDPVMALADLLSRLDESWLTILQKGSDMVLTSGIVSTDPETHSLSRIPDKVEFSFDCRSLSKTTLEDMRDLLKQEIKQIEQNRKVKFYLDEELYTAPAMMSENVTNSLKDAMRATGLEPFVMPSGGGHDAAIFANVGVPAGMVFVRNENGSHNPKESLELSDFLIGSEIIFNHLVKEIK